MGKPVLPKVTAPGRQQAKERRDPHRPLRQEPLHPSGDPKLKEEENKKERSKEKENIHGVNYGITVGSNDDSGARLVNTSPSPHLREAQGPSTINHGQRGSRADNAST